MKETMWKKVCSSAMPVAMPVAVRGDCSVPSALNFADTTTGTATPLGGSMVQTCADIGMRIGKACV